MSLIHTYKIKKAVNDNQARGSDLVHKVGSHKNVNELNLNLKKNDFTFDWRLNNKDSTITVSAEPSNLNNEE